MSKFLSKCVSLKNINPNVVKAEYAVRGKILIASLNYVKEDPENFKPIYCNIGNPQALGQVPLSFPRSVLSLVVSPELMDIPEIVDHYPSDVIERAKTIREGFGGGGDGAYTHSKGVMSIRDNVVKFIEERDGFGWDLENPSENIFLTDGASPGVKMMLKLLLRNETDGIMVKIPQYPLYSAEIQLSGGTMVPYYLDEASEWGLDIEEVERAYRDGTYRDGINIRAVVAINPGNPTGQILSRENMEQLIEFCMDKGLVLMADEVYQENIYDPTKEFVSFRKVAYDLGVHNDIEMVSFHSVSKGFLGECGRRGGYMEFSSAWDQDVIAECYKVASVCLCPNICGQIMTDLMVNPPKEGDESYEQYCSERDAILGSLDRRARKLVDTLNSLEGVSCNPAAGAMYAFPQIKLPEGAIRAAEQYVDPFTGKLESISPDLFYCLELLKEAQIVVVPGSGFRQVEGTFHFRTTFLPPEDQMDVVGERFKKFHEGFMQKYS